MIPIAKYDAEGRCTKAGLSLRPLKKTFCRAKRRLTPSAETPELIEYYCKHVCAISAYCKSKRSEH